MIRAASLATQAYEELRRRITEGRLAESAPLVIAVLARELGISHTPLREALARLHAEGLASFVENVGYRVALRPTPADFRHWMEARLVIEVNAIRAAAERAGPEAIAELAAINERIRASDFGNTFEGIRGFAELNAAFHRAIVALAANPFLLRAYDQIWLGAQFSRVHYRRGVTDQERIVDEHAAIVAALVEGNGARAAKSMEAHIVDSLARDQVRRERERFDASPPRGRRRAARSTEAGVTAGASARSRGRAPSP